MVAHHLVGGFAGAGGLTMTSLHLLAAGALGLWIAVGDQVLITLDESALEAVAGGYAQTVGDILNGMPWPQPSYPIPNPNDPDAPAPDVFF